MIILNRVRENIPIIVCKTCGKRALQSSVIELEDPALIKEMRYKKRKTWARIIKPSFNIYMSEGRKMRNKRIFFSALLVGCIEKKHKLQVIHLNGSKFHQSYLDTVKEMKEKREWIIKPKKKKKGERVNCASCGTRTDADEICMGCGRCEACCNCIKMRRAKKVLKLREEK